MSALSRIATTAFLISARRRGVEVHGSLSHGICWAMSCLSRDGSLPFAASEQLSPLLALVGRQAAKPCSSRKRSIFLWLTVMPPTSSRVEDQQLGHVALGAPARDGGAQSLEPVARLGERIILLRIDQQ